MLKARSLFIQLAAVALSVCTVVSIGTAATLSPAQMEQLKQLTPAQRSALAKKAGVTLPDQTPTNVLKMPPVVMKSRAVESGVLEGDMGENKPKGKTSTKAQSSPTDLLAKKTLAEKTFFPVSQQYRIGIGDRVIVHFFGEKPSFLNRAMQSHQDSTNNELLMRVDRNGLIMFPGVGGLLVAGLAKRDIEELITKKISTQHSSSTLKVVVEIQSFISHLLANITTEAKPMAVDTSIKQFGYDLFSGVPTTFAPATEVPVPPEYVLGPGDEIKVQLFGKENSEFSMTVDREGAIAFPNIGPITVSSMHFAEAKAFIAQQIKQKMIGVSASVTMGKLRSIRVFALGEVAQPGSYVVSGLATLSNALFVSGGVKKSGSLRKIQLKRAGKVVATLDLYDFLLHGDTSHDVRLLPQDVVYVPPIGKTVGVAGKVLRPAIFELKEERTLADILLLAGGLRPTAYRKKVQIERISGGAERKVLDILLSKRGEKRRLHDGDLVKVYSVLDFEENPVFLLGNVKRPGKYAWHQGMSLRDLIPNDKALLPETWFKYAVIERERAQTREPMIMHVPLDAVLKGEKRIPLFSRDKVFVFNRAHFREQPKVTVSGSIQHPGGYALKNNMHLIDLVMAAGGLLRDAYQDEVEFYRTDPKSRVVTLHRYSMKQALQGDAASNPLLHDLDRVVIHSVWEMKQRYTVTIRGEIKHPGEFTLVAGMHLTDLLFAAGSVTERAYLPQAEMTRYRVENGEQRVSQHIQVDLAQALHGDVMADIALEPYDVVVVRRLSNWRDTEHASITGEVRFPGSYPVEEGERLSSLIARVGGFTDHAYLPAAVFTRIAIREAQQKRLDDIGKKMEADIDRQSASLSSMTDATIIKRSQKDLERTRAMLKQIRDAKVTGRLVIHLADMQHFKGSDFDLRLRDGDQLYIPQKPDEVLVLGQVYNQTALLYRHDFSRDDYINLAGGVDQFADENHIYVIRANGEVDANYSPWRRKNLHPGDTIVVPLALEQFHLIDSMLDWSRVAANIGISLASFKAVGIL
ncbi:MAG: SLBB domain-containing protein [Mariprofundales bacterium]